MALRMPRPIANASGVYHLNIRVPGDLAAKVKGTVVTLPLDGAQVTIRPSDKVIVSLRTRDPSLAKARFSEAEQALSRHWDSLRRGPVCLTHIQLVALAGERYRASVKAYEEDACFMPDGFLALVRQFETDVAYWRNNPDDEFGDIGEHDGRILASLARPHGPELLAYERGCDIAEFGVSVTYDAAITNLFGREADELCRVRHLQLDAATRLRLIREIATAYRLLDRKLIRNASSDYRPDENAARFPDFIPPPVDPEIIQTPSRRGDGSGRLGIQTLFERWRDVRGDSVAASTVRRYGPSIASLQSYSKGKDIRLLSEDDIWDWAKHRVSEGCSARTVNRNDLVAVVSLLEWATSRAGGRLRKNNPAKGVKLEEPKLRVKREKTFRSAEIARILSCARAVEIARKDPQPSASRRWAPWICAYSGARIQEVCHLSRDNVWREGNIWIMQFPMTKDGHARVVPIHQHLIDEGLLDYWEASDPGYLFISHRPLKYGASRSAQEMRASEIASWIQSQVSLENGVSPNHGWRHTFSTNAETAGIPKRVITAITGHNKIKDASDGYITPSVMQMKKFIDTYPIYNV